VKTGAATQRYLGTIRTNGTAGFTQDMSASRLVWNYYNRIARSLYMADTNAHTYTTSSWRWWNNNQTLGGTKMEVLTGVSEDMIEVSSHVEFYALGASYYDSHVCLALDTLGNCFDRAYLGISAPSQAYLYGFYMSARTYQLGYHIFMINEYGYAS
jgi:hypothetical protein